VSLLGSIASVAGKSDLGDGGRSTDFRRMSRLRKNNTVQSEKASVDFGSQEVWIEPVPEFVQTSYLKNRQA